MTEVNAVRQVFAANQRFYEAFGSLEIQRMAAVWRQDEEVQCIHPGWPRLLGWQAVRDSWIRIFNNTRSMTFQITDTKVTVRGPAAWVVCVERITMVIDEEPQETRVLATNLFMREDDYSTEPSWLMVHHHGSPVFHPLEGTDEATER